MIVTPELMRLCGSGNDPNDITCMAGYEYFVREMKVRHPDTLSFPTLKSAIDDLVIEVREGRIDRAEGLAHLSFLRGLKSNPMAIRNGGSCEETGVFLCNDTEVIGADGLQSYKETEIEKARDNPFNLVKVTKTTRTNRGSLMRPVAHKNQLRESDQVFVFDERTGRHISSSGLLEDIA